MLRIVKRSAKILKIPLTHGGALELAKRSRGTPRVANRLLRRIRDFAQVEGEGVITSRIAQTALSKLEIDELGLDSMDRKILETLVEKFNGGPVGIKTLTVAVDEEVITIEELYEPYLIKIGFINRTPRGRFATPLAYEYLRGKRKE
jgi:Holliday junction DNA helicase RuvB